MSEDEPRVHSVTGLKLNMDEHADGLSKQLFSLGTLLKLAAVGSSVAGAVAAAYVAFVATP